MRIWGVNFRSPAALDKATTTALNKDKAVRVRKARAPPNILGHFGERARMVQGPLNRGVSNEGFPNLDSSVPVSSFFGLWDLRDFGDSPICPGIFPIFPFPLSRPFRSTYEEQVRKGSTTQSSGCRKRVCNKRGCLQMQMNANKRAQTQTNVNFRL